MHTRALEGMSGFSDKFPCGILWFQVGFYDWFSVTCHSCGVHGGCCHYHWATTAQGLTQYPYRKFYYQNWYCVCSAFCVPAYPSGQYLENPHLCFSHKPFPTLASRRTLVCGSSFLTLKPANWFLRGIENDFCFWSWGAEIIELMSLQCTSLLLCAVELAYDSDCACLLVFYSIYKISGNYSSLQSLLLNEPFFFMPVPSLWTPIRGW